MEEISSRCWICINLLERDLTFNKAAEYQEGLDCILAGIGFNTSQCIPLFLSQDLQADFVPCVVSVMPFGPELPVDI